MKGTEVQHHKPSRHYSDTIFRLIIFLTLISIFIGVQIGYYYVNAETRSNLHINDGVNSNDAIKIDSTNFVHGSSDFKDGTNPSNVTNTDSERKADDETNTDNNTIGTNNITDPYGGVVFNDKRFLWSTPRSDGFNNQLISIYEAINCARQLGRRLVLPVMFENVRYDTAKKGPYPFTDYFDVNALKRVVPVVTLKDLEEKVPCKHVLYSSSQLPPLYTSYYIDKFKISVTLDMNAWRNEQEPCIDDSVCMDEREGLGDYSNYARGGQGYDARLVPQFKMIREGLQPHPDIMALAQSGLDILGERFNAIHLRRGDYSKKCSQMTETCARFGPEAFYQSTEHVTRTLGPLIEPNLPLFVSTTHREEGETVLKGFSFPSRTVYMEDVPIPSHIAWMVNRTDMIGLASQVIASRAVQFVGNRFSSYTSEINSMRFLRNGTMERLFF